MWLAKYVIVADLGDDLRGSRPGRRPRASNPGVDARGRARLGPWASGVDAGVDPGLGLERRTPGPQPLKPRTPGPRPQVSIPSLDPPCLERRPGVDPRASSVAPRRRPPSLERRRRPSGLEAPEPRVSPPAWTLGPRAPPSTPEPRALPPASAPDLERRPRLGPLALERRPPAPRASGRPARPAGRRRRCGLGPRTLADLRCRFVIARACPCRSALSPRARASRLRRSA